MSGGGLFFGGGFGGLTARHKDASPSIVDTNSFISYSIPARSTQKKSQQVTPKL